MAFQIANNNIVAWNRRRYPQEYNQELTNYLIQEEYREWTEAVELHQQLDALGDLYYIIVGALWKSNMTFPGTKVSSYDIGTEIQYHSIWCAFEMSGYQIPRFLELERLAYNFSQVLDTDQEEAYHLLFWLYQSVLIHFVQLKLTMAEVAECLRHICFSNDSKEIRWLQPFDKGILKGPGFCSPHQDLYHLAERIKQRLNYEQT